MLSVLVMTCGATPVQADDGIHIGASAEFFALYKYPNFKSHKAIAVGPAGYWANSYSWPSASAAAKEALSTCKTGLRRAKIQGLRDKNCVLFDIDGKRTGKATPVGIPFGTVAEGEDLPWQFGNMWNATATTKRGTMLLLHGCDGFRTSG
jgi:hypothetical protein